MFGVHTQYICMCLCRDKESVVRARERGRRRIVLSSLSLSLGRGKVFRFTNVFEVINNEIRIAIQREREREWVRVGGFRTRGGGEACAQTMGNFFS